jgi:hypothetical protein
LWDVVLPVGARELPEDPENNPIRLFRVSAT